MEPTWSDEELIGWYYWCEDEAWERLFSRWVSRLERLFWQRGVAREDGKDLAMEVIVRIGRSKFPPHRASRYDPSRGASFATWVFTIANNRLRSFWRKEGRPFRSEEEDEEDGREALLESLVDPAPLPEEPLWRQERIEMVWKCVESLPSPEQEVVCLWLWNEGDITLERMAFVLGVSVSTVHRRLRRAFCLMKQCLQENGWEANGEEKENGK